MVVHCCVLNSSRGFRSDFRGVQKISILLWIFLRLFGIFSFLRILVHTSRISAHCSECAFVVHNVEKVDPVDESAE